jgi:pimeloyl-ACP methyl ester carboxylesterase
MAALRQPSLFRRLVLFEPIVFPPEGIRPPGVAPADPEESPMVMGARRRRAMFPSHQAAIENFASKPPLMFFTPEALRAYVVHGFAPDDDGVHLKCRPATEAATFATGNLHGTWERLPEIATETLVVAGQVQDMQPSKIAAGVADRLPNGTYLQLDVLDHFGPMVRPLLVADVIAESLSRT